MKKMGEGVKKITYFGFFVTYFAIIFNINMTYFGPKSNVEIRALRVGPSWEWIELKVEGEGEGYSFFCFKCTLHGSDLLDNRIGRLHTNFQISATLSKKVLIFSPNFIHFHFHFHFKVDKIWGWFVF